MRRSVVPARDVSSPVRLALVAALLAIAGGCGPAVDIEGVLYEPGRVVPPRRDGGVSTTTTSTTPRPDAGPRDSGTADAGDPNCPEPTLASIDAKVLRPSCATRDCHVGPTAAEGLAFEGSVLDVAARLRQPSAQSASRMPLVTAGQPGASYLYLKVFLTTPPTGDRMPPGSELTACELSAIRRWIEAGAP